METMAVAQIDRDKSMIGSAAAAMATADDPDEDDDRRAPLAS